MDTKKMDVVCFGEILWDVFPTSKNAGGAPMNVAANLNKLQINASLISRVGIDEDGDNLIKFLHQMNINSSFVQKDTVHPTGVVDVQIGENKDAKYDIVFPSAWDFIESDKATEEMVSNADYFVFGSLAARNINSRITLFNLLNNAKTKVFDINLRYPHYQKELIEGLLEVADIVKVNDEELYILNNWFLKAENKISSIAQQIREKFKIDQLIVTRGEKGAVVCVGNQIIEQEGFKNNVVDTVGSGDAFLAAFLAKQIKGDSIKDCLRFACATGSFMVGKRGANPPYTESEIIDFLNKITIEK